MVVKHPHIFRDADLVVINKIDLAKAMKINVKNLERDVKSINPKAKVVMVNSRKGEGLSELISSLKI
jgi:hydrogenase nickel incorporation protein HypB